MALLLDEAVDGGLQIDEGMEHAMLQASPRQLREEPFDGIQPGAWGRREMERPARIPREQGADLGMLVRRIIVQDHVDYLAGWYATLDLVEEANELLVPMALPVLADHAPVEHVQSDEQGGCAVALVVTGHRCASALLERQARLCPVERLDLALLVDA